jgi:hypothetical protein
MLNGRQNSVYLKVEGLFHPGPWKQTLRHHKNGSSQYVDLAAGDHPQHAQTATSQCGFLIRSDDEVSKPRLRKETEKPKPISDWTLLPSDLSLLICETAEE